MERLEHGARYRHNGGDDSYQNLIIVSDKIHILIHAANACDGKLSRTVWGGGKLGDCIKELPIIKSVYPAANTAGVAHHINEQFAAEWLQLYPSANILVSTKKDFETRNRRKFCGRIATGDYDAVIIGHSQFEKIPMSLDFQVRTLENQLDDILQGLEQAKEEQGERFTIKQLKAEKAQ